MTSNDQCYMAFVPLNTTPLYTKESDTVEINHENFVIN